MLRQVDTSCDNIRIPFRIEIRIKQRTLADTAYPGLPYQRHPAEKTLQCPAQRADAATNPS